MKSAINTHTNLLHIAARRLDQQCKEHVGYNYVAVFIRLVVVASQICEIPRNFTKIRIYSSSRTSEVIDLGANRKQLPISH